MDPSNVAVAPGLLPEMVAAIVSAHANRAALDEDGRALSYGDLDRMSGRLADRLVSLGAGRGGLIAIGLPRSAARIAATLAVWQVGGASLQLDPAWPDRYLQTILADARPDLLICDPGSASRGLLGEDRTMIVAPDDSSPAAEPDRLRPSIRRSPDELAYVIYTSGSTGRPKGVEITHGNLANLVRWHNAAFGITPEDRATHLAGLGFDAAIWEVWPYLATGASVCLAPEAVRSSAGQLHDWLIAVGATTAFVPTLLAEQMLDLPWSGARLRHLLTGGDRLGRFAPADLPFPLVNNYGPTECTVVATSGIVPARLAGGAVPSIGRAIAGVRVHIVDEAGSTLPAGEIGEIWIGGAGVARGYRGAPSLTAASFVPDRLGGEPGGRLYRTGDLGSVGEDGEIRFHGRLDDQVQVRGQRVEPGEVAAVLARYPGVDAAAVLPAERDGAAELVGYLAVRAEAALDAADLSAFLAERLPAYAMPSAFVRLDALPVTANGKLDRGALPPPSAANALPARAHAQPTTPAERLLATILAEVMRRPAIGVDENFFLLGGHSLLGTQVVLRAGEAFGIELTLRHLFQAPTVRQLALVVEALVLQRIEGMSDSEVRLLAGC